MLAASFQHTVYKLTVCHLLKRFLLNEKSSAPSADLDKKMMITIVPPNDKGLAEPRAQSFILDDLMP
jgi:hypothetical protein